MQHTIKNILQHLDEAEEELMLGSYTEAIAHSLQALAETYAIWPVLLRQRRM
jgi:HEPN domain-containing protein